MLCTHMPCLFPFIPVSMSVQSGVIKPRQSRPEQSVDVAEAHTVHQIHRPVFDLVLALVVWHEFVQTDTLSYTHTEG